MRIATGEVQENLPPLSPAAELGRKGGEARAKAMTPERRAEIARKAAAKRWNSVVDKTGQKSGMVAIVAEQLK